MSKIKPDSEMKYRGEYIKRITKVLEFIDNNLSLELSVENLANIACFSPYHFHRIFHSIVGDSVSNYVKKRKLTAAANKLLYSPGATVTAIALEFGFSSHSDFSRSFRAYFKTSPTQFVKSKMSRRKLIDSSALSHREAVGIHGKEDSDIDRKIRVISLPDFNVAYVRNVGLSEEYKSTAIENSFQMLFVWAKARDLVNDDMQIIGITLDSPEVIPLSECRYDICITVPESIQADGVAGVRKVNANGRYLSYCFGREDAEFSRIFFQTIDYIYGYWMMTNGYLPDDKPCVEFYRTDRETGNVIMEFCIPIKPF
ncbi:MAG: AraC family transcriptional regulator [Clostridia bacterium]|nr:AraC family transcriptional regulator [Clostridia bacterium]